MSPNPPQTHSDCQFATGAMGPWDRTLTPPVLGGTGEAREDALRALPRLPTWARWSMEAADRDGKE